MQLADVNVLIAAFRADAGEHRRCRAWLDNALTDPARFGVSPLALAAVVRITTNRHVYGEAATLDTVFAFCATILDRPNCQVIVPGDRHFTIFERLCRETGTVGPRVTDAWFAALAIEWGCEWITLDRDYSRFKDLRQRQP